MPDADLKSSVMRKKREILSRYGLSAKKGFTYPQEDKQRTVEQTKPMSGY
jgi:hypothetical protein